MTYVKSLLAGAAASLLYAILFNLIAIPVMMHRHPPQMPSPLLVPPASSESSVGFYLNTNWVEYEEPGKDRAHLNQNDAVETDNDHKRRWIRMNNTGCVLSCILTITLFASTTFGQASITARDVINKMAGVYAQSSTYRDEGQVTINGSGRIISFKTLFNRPASLYKFEFTSSGPQPPTFNHFVSWRTAPGDVRIWSTLSPQVELKPMNMALAPGLALPVGHTVPVLLLPEAGFVSFSLSSDWMDSVPPEEATVDGRACYKITGHYANGLDNTLSVWIDRQSFLIRKLVDKRQTITYDNPQVNVSIEAALFDFQPPAANR